MHSERSAVHWRKMCHSTEAFTIFHLVSFYISPVEWFFFELLHSCRLLSHKHFAHVLISTPDNHSVHMKRATDVLKKTVSSPRRPGSVFDRHTATRSECLMKSVAKAFRWNIRFASWYMRFPFDSVSCVEFVTSATRRDRIWCPSLVFSWLSLQFKSIEWSVRSTVLH